MKWEVIIGLETHVQLATVSKIFSSASTQFGASPNTQANEVDLALPGTLPVPNRKAVECAIRFGLAIGATIAPQSIFSRKHYFYPDLPKGYQISQYDQPVVQGGTLKIFVEDTAQEKIQEKIIQLTRAHLEEDAGKSLHEDFAGMSGIDLNRAGTPLLEIVTEPVMRSAAEAVAYAKALHALVVWLGICDGNMQEGSFRCDANVSIRPEGATILGTRTEIKNLNSFRFLEEAIHYEVNRQQSILEDGGKITQETRLYDPDKKETRAMRSKEDAQDYRYFPDPDLPPLIIEERWIAQVRDTMPELPDAMRHRFETQYELNAEDAAQLSSSRALAEYFEATVKQLKENFSKQSESDAASSVLPMLSKAAANWLLGELASQLNRENISINDTKISAQYLASLIFSDLQNIISHKTAKDIFRQLWENYPNHSDANLVEKIIEEQGLSQISDQGALEKMIDEVLRNNPKLVEEFHSGKTKAFNALIGQIMKASQGKANPQQVNTCLTLRLDNTKN